MESLFDLKTMSYRVTCSCGQSTVVRFSAIQQKYVPDHTQWKFDVDRFWNCGKPGHRQMDVTEVK